MKTIIDEETAPSTNASDWGLSRAAAFAGVATGTKSDDLNQSCDDKSAFGGTQTIRVDVRVIAATSRDLDQMACCGEFRSDLYYRLNVFPLQVPAFRDRANDILELVCHFVKLAARKLNKTIEQSLRI